MDNLIAKLKSAAEGSRELSDAVALAVGWSPVPNPTMAGGLVGRWYSPTGEMSDMFGPPRFTTSLEAAMTFVPRGWLVSIHRGFDDDGEYFTTVKLTDSFTVGRGCDEAEAVTALGRKGAHRAFQDPTPLALCIAALKARAQQEMNRE